MKSLRFWLPLLMLWASQSGAHSASDAFLTLTAEPSEVGGGSRARFHGQWDIALRDLDFVLHLDDDGDGRLTWKEVRRHQTAIASFAYSHLHFDIDARDGCSLTPSRQLIDGHADGAYAALFFDVLCKRATKKILLKYDLFFDIDPSHRGIFVMHTGADVATSVLSPQSSRIALDR